MELTRESIAATYLKGRGIEIGALHNPLKIPADTHVTYVDRLSEFDLRKQYSDLNDSQFVHTDVIDDGEKLEKFGDNSQDFVIANHFLEHCENPICAIFNMLRVLRKNGILYMAIPDKRYTFDNERPITSIEHCMRDYEEGPGWSRGKHFEEWTRLVNKTDDDVKAEEEINHLMRINYSIHFHVWTSAEIYVLFETLKKKLNFKFKMDYTFENQAEMILILRKT